MRFFDKMKGERGEMKENTGGLSVFDESSKNANAFVCFSVFLTAKLRVFVEKWAKKGVKIVQAARL